MALKISIEIISRSGKQVAPAMAELELPRGLSEQVAKLLTDAGYTNVQLKRVSLLGYVASID